MKVGDYVQILSNSPRCILQNRIGKIIKLNVEGLRKGFEVNDYVQIEIYPTTYKVDKEDFKILSECQINEYRNYKPLQNEKTSKSCIKGHLIYFDTKYQVFRYSDNDELVCENNRVCAKCNKASTDNGHDYCIANLPGVKAGCCGHGQEQAYILFENGIIIRGKIEYPH